MAWPVVAAMAAGTAAQLYSSYKQSEAQKEAAEKEYQSRMAAIAQLREQGKLTEQEYNSLAKQVQEYYQNRGSLGTQEDVNEYKAAIKVIILKITYIISMNLTMTRLRKIS